MAKINAVIFDLDNVLYDEWEYFRAAFEKIAVFLSERCDRSWQDIFNKLLTDLQKKSSMYPRLFNDLLLEFGLDQSLVAELLRIFSSVNADLRLFADSEDLLLALRGLDIKLGLVTNGNVATQKNKVKLLRIEKYFDSIIYARELGTNKEKPDPEAYRRLLENLGVKAEETLCIGDNPFTDFLGAKKLGIRTVRLLGGEFKDVSLGPEYGTDSTVTALFDIYKIVANQSC